MGTEYKATKKLKDAIFDKSLRTRHDGHCRQRDGICSQSWPDAWTVVQSHVGQSSDFSFGYHRRQNEEVLPKNVRGGVEEQPHPRLLSRPVWFGSVRPSACLNVVTIIVIKKRTGRLKSTFGASSHD